MCLQWRAVAQVSDVLACEKMYYADCTYVSSVQYTAVGVDIMWQRSTNLDCARNSIEALCDPHALSSYNPVFSPVHDSPLLTPYAKTVP
jgi:hypothetical protein